MVSDNIEALNPAAFGAAAPGEFGFVRGTGLPAVSAPVEQHVVPIILRQHGAQTSAGGTHQDGCNVRCLQIGCIVVHHGGRQAICAAVQIRLQHGCANDTRLGIFGICCQRLVHNQDYVVVVHAAVAEILIQP